MKRNFLIYFVLFVYFSPILFGLLEFIPEDINLNPYDYARITDVDYKAVLVDEVGSDGKVVVTERLTFDIHAASKSNLFWELWRDLPEDTVDGVKVHYNVLSVKEILEDGSEIVYGQSNELYWDDIDYINGPRKWYHSEGPYNPDFYDYECVFFYVDGLYREKVTFEVEYEMYNAALRYSDCSELYLSMYSESTIKHLNSFKAQILIPNKDMPSYGNYEAHTFGTNTHTFPFRESDSINPGYHTFIIDLDKDELKFKPYNEYIEFTLVSYGADRHKFTNYASKNYYYYDLALEELVAEQYEYDNLPKEAQKNKTAVFILSIPITLFVFVSIRFAKNKFKGKHVFYKPSMQIKYFREIPSNLDPNFAAALTFCKEKKKKESKDIYAALLLSLVRKKYISLEKKYPNIDWKPANVKIILLQEPISEPFTLSNIANNNLSIIDELSFDSIDEVTTVSETAESIASAESSETTTQSTPINNLEPLTPNEEYYLNLIVKYYKRDSELTMYDFQNYVQSDYQSTDSFVRKVEKSIVDIGISQGYFQKSEYDKPKKMLQKKAKSSMILGILLLTVANIISYHTRLDLAFGSFTIVGIAFIIKSLILKNESKDAVLLTQFGEDEYAKWKGLYDFLNSQTLMNEKTVIELPLWEQYLVYATAFGISEKVIKALSLRCATIDMDSSPMFNNTYYRSHSFYSSGRSFRSSVRSASHTAHSYSSGGYYGGGGRGGGGGGGGH